MTQIHVIHETGVGILIGFVFGLVIFFIQDLPDYEFNEEIFFYGLLPPMIFSGGYNLKKSTFFKNFSYISLFGALGTVMTFGIIFGLTYLINWLGTRHCEFRLDSGMGQYQPKGGAYYSSDHKVQRHNLRI